MAGRVPGIDGRPMGTPSFTNRYCSRPAPLLLHGVPKSRYYWHRIISILSEHFTVIAPDIRGFGDSFRPASGYDMETIDLRVRLVGGAE
jgi:pimeloyl-ACP methyl ester carboxylesterase